MSYKLISDFSYDEAPGGAEYNDMIILQELRSKGKNADFIKSRSLNLDRLKKLKKGTKFIISNFVTIGEQEKKYISENFNYVIWEHDHKYLLNRNPAKFINFKAPKEKIINYQFYKNAKMVMCQTKFHSDILKKNLNLNNIVNLSGNFWSDEDLEYIEQISSTAKMDICSVLNSPMASKNTRGTIDYCQKKSIEFELISDRNYKNFLKKMSKNSKFIFLPSTPETLSRICVEAKMLGCAVMTNKLVGCKYEEWFNGSQKQIIDYMRSFRIKTIELLLAEL